MVISSLSQSTRFVFFILLHLCLAVRQPKDCVEEQQPRDKGFPDAKQGTPNVKAEEEWRKAMRHLRRSYGHRGQTLLPRDLFDRSAERVAAQMYSAGKIKEEVPPVSLQPRSEPKILPREPSFTKPTSLHKTLSIQNLTQLETPWENVTLNRCLFVAISILVLTSGFQKLHETLRGQGTIEAEEELGLTMRRSELLRHRGRLPEPQTSLWEVMFWWLPDLDDEDEDEDDDEEIKRRKSKREVTRRTSRGLRNRPLPEKKLLKQRDGKLKDRRAGKAEANKIKDKRGRARKEDPEEAADEEDEREEETNAKKNKLQDGK